MVYKRETVVNIGALERSIDAAYLNTKDLRREIEKEMPNPDRVKHFLNGIEMNLLSAKDFEFIVEVRKITE